MREWVPTSSMTCVPCRSINTCNVCLQTGDAFAAAADIYVRRFLQKGIPSLYTDLKSLYSNPAKAEVGCPSVWPAVLSDLHHSAPRELTEAQ